MRNAPLIAQTHRRRRLNSVTLKATMRVACDAVYARSAPPAGVHARRAGDCRAGEVLR